MLPACVEADSRSCTALAYHSLLNQPAPALHSGAQHSPGSSLCTVSGNPLLAPLARVLKLVCPALSKKGWHVGLLIRNGGGNLLLSGANRHQVKRAQ